MCPVTFFKKIRQLQNVKFRFFCTLLLFVLIQSRVRGTKRLAHSLRSKWAHSYFSKKISQLQNVKFQFFCTVIFSNRVPDSVLPIRISIKPLFYNVRVWMVWFCFSGKKWASGLILIFGENGEKVQFQIKNSSKSLHPHHGALHGSYLFAWVTM